MPGELGRVLLCAGCATAAGPTAAQVDRSSSVVLAAHSETEAADGDMLVE